MRADTFFREYQNTGYEYVEVIKSSSPIRCGVGHYHLRSSICSDPVHSSDSKSDKSVEGFISEGVKEASLRSTRRHLKFLFLNNVTASWRFLTLTYGSGGCSDRKKVFRDIEKMVERMEKETRRDVKYICVLEKHKDGQRYHAHILIHCNYYSNEFFKKHFWKNGFVVLRRLKKKSPNDSPIKVMKYLLKYISKDSDDVEFRKKRFSASRNLIREPLKYNMLYDDDGLFNQALRNWKNAGWIQLDYYTVEKDGILWSVFLFGRRGRPFGAPLQAGVE